MTRRGICALVCALFVLLTAAPVAAHPDDGIAGTGGGHGLADDDGFWNVLEGFATKTGFRLVFTWDTDAPVAGHVRWGFDPDDLDRLAVPVTDAVDTAQIAIADIPRSETGPDRIVHWQVEDQLTGATSPMRSFPAANAWTSDADGIYEIDALLQLDTKSLPDDIPIDQGLRQLADGIRIMAERIWDATDGYVRMGKVVVTDTVLNHPVNVPFGHPVSCAPAVVGEPAPAQHTLADFLVETTVPFDSHTWGPSPMIDNPCTAFYVGRVGQLVVPWRDDLHMGYVFAHELGHYAFGLPDLYPANSTANCVNNEFDITLMHNTGGWTGTRWRLTQLDRGPQFTPCDYGSEPPSWPVLVSRYDRIPIEGRFGDGLPDRTIGDPFTPRGNPLGGAHNIFVLENLPGTSSIEHYFEAPEEEQSFEDADIRITSPTDRATVPAGEVEVSGFVDLEGVEFGATLSGPRQAVTDEPATYSVSVRNAEGDVTCAITAEGDPVRDGEAPDGCSVGLTWTTEGTFTVTGEATDGTDSDADTLQVVVRDPGSLPDPDGSIAGGITIFSDLNPALAHNEAIALVTSPVDPAPKFLPGEPTTFRTRFTEDFEGVAGPGGDRFTWHIWTADGELVDTVPCFTQQDSSLGDPLGFDCPAPVTMPTDVGRYLTTLRFEGDGRWSCHSGEALFDLDIATGIPHCIKAFDVGVDTTITDDLASPMVLTAAMPSLVAPGTDADPLTDATFVVEGAELPLGIGPVAQQAREAPSEVPNDPEIVDGTGDVTVAGLPIDHMDIEAAWFDNDDAFLYVGMKVADIPADPLTTAQVAYHVHFHPDHSESPTLEFGVPGDLEFVGLRVQAVLSLVGFDAGLTLDSEHHAELQFLATDGTSSFFGKVADLDAVGVDPDTDIIWWAVPRQVLASPAPGDTLSELSATVVPAVRGLVTFGTDLGDSAEAEPDRTYAIREVEGPLEADAGGPYAGAVDSPIAIAGTGRGGSEPYDCRWDGPGAASFTDSEACQTTVTFDEPGGFAIELMVTDGVGDSAFGAASVTVGSGTGERVEVFVDDAFAGGTDVATDPSTPRAEWSVSIDLSGPDGDRAIVARWFDAGDRLLAEDAITVEVLAGSNEPPTAVIDAPDRVRAGETALFDGSGSSDPDGEVMAWDWDMGDGTELSGEVVEHAYSQPGPKDVVLTVTDDRGATATATHRIRVQGPPAGA